MLESAIGVDLGGTKALFVSAAQSLRLDTGPSFSGDAASFYTPTNWKQLDDTDTDIGTAGALPFDVGTTHYVATLGKDGKLHLMHGMMKQIKVS